ncbi:MAG: hypothetical protein L6437_00850 [Kiritimatiellae bacterium]|nr:hypothetical protein [Kiritimatiellia bacterium]
MSKKLQDPVCMLIARGVNMPHPETVFIGADVAVDRIAAGVTIHPGCRLSLAERKDGR